MGNIITQAAAPGSMERQTKGQALTLGTDNDAKGFSTEMDKAVKKSADSRADDARSARERGDELATNGYNENAMDDMKETDKSGSAAAGLLIAPTAVTEEVASLSALTASSKPVEFIVGKSSEVVKAVAVAEGAEITVTASPEDKSIKSLNESALNHKYIDPQKLSEAQVVTDDVNDAMEVMEEGKERIGTAKATAHDKFVKGDLAVPSSAQITGATDDTPDLTDAKTASAAAVVLERSGDSCGGGLGDANADKKGPYNQAGQRGAEALGVSQLARQADSYEAVVADGKFADAERAEVYEKLSTGVSMSIAKDGGEVKLSLRPDHLGSLNIKLNIEDGKVNARIVVESAAVKEALDADTGTLREVFAKNNLILDKYTVEITGRGFLSENSFSNFSGFSGFNDNTSEGFSSSNDRPSAAIEDLHTSTGMTTGSRVSGIDLFI